MQQHDAWGIGGLRADQAIFELAGVDGEEAVSFERHALASPSSCPGLDAGIHVFLVAAGWMAGSSPAMTITKSRANSGCGRQLLTCPLAQLEALDLAGRG